MGDDPLKSNDWTRTSQTQDSRKQKPYTGIRHALSFGVAAEVYHRVRPPYADAAVRWAFGNQGLDVVDLGAGTGILTRSLTALSHRCTAIEPDPRMRRILRRHLPETIVLHGTAEAMPLPDECADVVVAAECYHWFSPSAAHPEIARVLQPNGSFVVMWQLRDDTIPWAAALTEVLRAYDDTGASTVSPPESGAHFTPFEKRLFPFNVTHTRESLIDLYRSHSFYIAADPRHRALLERDIGHLIDTHPDLRGEEQFIMPYVTQVHRAHRKG